VYITEQDYVFFLQGIRWDMCYDIFIFVLLHVSIAIIGDNCLLETAALAKVSILQVLRKNNKVKTKNERFSLVSPRIQKARLGGKKCVP